MPSREELLQSIKPGMKLNRAFFFRIYGYEISFPGFKDIAIKALEDAGCSKAEEYYNMTVSEYERKHREELKPVARLVRQKWNEEWEKIQKGCEESRKQEKKIQNLTKSELTELCKKLLQEGIITSPEQFATAVGLDQ